MFDYYVVAYFIDSPLKITAQTKDVMKTNQAGLILAGILLLTAAGSLAQSEQPAIKGGWWKIAEHAPDVSPWNNPGVHNACDFSIWQDETGTWHLVACIRETTFPGATRLFHHWTSPSLTKTNWTPAVHTNHVRPRNGDQRNFCCLESE